MSVFQLKHANGKRSRVWRIEFKDHRGFRRRVSGYRDKKESEYLERTIGELVVCRLNSRLPDERLVRAVEAMPGKVRARLIAFGVLDKHKEHAAKSIQNHLADYKAVLIAEGASSKWAQTVYSRALRIFEAAGCETLADITRDRVQVAGDKLRLADGISNWTHNHRLAACKSFTRWATPERMNADPLAKLKGLNAKAARKHQRRALTLREARELVVAAEAGPVVWSVSGSDRALIYRMALETGLRANEIATLTRSAFDLSSAQPTVTVEARNAKNRRVATLPLTPGLVGALRLHLSDKLPSALAFNMPASSHTAEMIRADLTAAGVEYETEEGFADFHALRHTFITNLARAGVMPHQAKRLARHSSITLTMDYYTHTSIGDDALAVAKLPSLDTPKAETA
ncbi:MAG: tyrosine-type recombinase/integrase [Planctomycetes bacterium]|nr:tyrosine-type recombinase/integrase [Planctomycetota bacterium]